MQHPIIVRPLTTSDNDSLWQDFVFSHPEHSVFHDLRWKRVLERAFAFKTFYLIAQRGSETVGIMPLAEVKTVLFGHSLVSLPFCHYAGPLVVEANAAKDLIEYATVLAKQLDVEYLEIRNLGKGNTEWPANKDLYVTFRQPLELDDEAAMQTIPRKQRAMVRKGLKANLVLRSGTTKEFFDVYSDNVHRHGSPTYSKKYFDILLEEFGEDAGIEMVTKETGEPVSGVLSLASKFERFPIYAGDYSVARTCAGNDFKYWALQRQSVKMGKQWFNYGRSKVNTGSYDFKKNWGFTAVPLVYEFLLLKRDSIPSNNPNNPKFSLIISTWRKLPRSFVNWLGPWLVRGLG
jgi:FemAB-related protein (PEP-CTERM system-associated)